LYECRNFKFASALTTENMQGCCYCYCKINDVQAVSFYCWNEKSAYDCFLFFFRIHLGRVLTFECLKMKSMFKPNVSFCVPLLLMWVIKNRYYWCSYKKVIYMYQYYRLREIFTKYNVHAYWFTYFTAHCLSHQNKIKPWAF